MNHIVDIVGRFPVPGITSQVLIGALRPLQPRLYSIASSLAAAPDAAQLTVAPVRYAPHDESRAGVASGMLADRAERDTVLPVYIQSNAHYRLPTKDDQVILIDWKSAGEGKRV